MLSRRLARPLEAALSDTPVVLLVGARQSGKSTLCRDLLERRRIAGYRTFDDTATLEWAQRDPTGFVASLPAGVVLDEIQRAPGLFLEIKRSVDEDRRPGRFLLTGSANVLNLPRLADSLAGRMEVKTLWPLSQGEIDGHVETFVDDLFAATWSPKVVASVSRKDLITRILRGGFPEAVARRDSDRRTEWFASYVKTMLERDVRDLANVEALTAIPNLLSLLASRIGGLHNSAEVSRSIGVPSTTVARHLALLETIYMVGRLPGWWSKRSHRLIRAPKLLLADSGVAAHLTRCDEALLEAEPVRLGPLLENFVVMEILKQASWSKERPELSHFRTAGGREVDLVLEGRGGRIVGVEIKATATPRADDFRGLETLREVAGTSFVRGVLLHGGRDVLPFGDRMLAVPLGALWQPGKTGVRPTA
jgi:predicted AAA+ superfamily ATPase